MMMNASLREAYANADFFLKFFLSFFLFFLQTYYTILQDHIAITI